MSGPRLDSSPLEAKNPGVFHGSAATFHPDIKSELNLTLHMFTEMWEVIHMIQ